MNLEVDKMFKDSVLGHPAGLFVLFFTEMWERFSYYGMRALLVLFLVSSFGLGGWDWPRENALALYGTYTGLVYITPIVGGYLADKYLGYRWAVIIGALVMTLGHASMAIEVHPFFLYFGIFCLIIGNGFFKPNMTSIISSMYKNYPEKKDGAYTIFYMGVNAGAFLGILLCGYLGEKVGWSWGFGVAGIFMFLGMLQFYFSQSIFGELGSKPKTELAEHKKVELTFEGDQLTPFSVLDRILVVISATIGVIWILNDPISKISGFNILLVNDIDFSNYFILIGLFSFLTLLTMRIVRYPTILRDRMLAIVFFAIMTVIFWMSFEQAGGSMTIFAKDYTQRIMSGTWYYVYIIVNILITVIPVLIISWVLFRLVKVTFTRIRLANAILIFSFIIIWGIIFWMIKRDMDSKTYVVEYNTIQTYLTPESYNSNKNQFDRMKKLLLGGAKFDLKGDEIEIESIEYNGATIKLQKSKLVKKTEKKEEQDKFNQTYIDAFLKIEEPEKAVVHYSEKLKPLTAPLNELSFSTNITENTVVGLEDKTVMKKREIMDVQPLKEGDEVKLLDIDKKGKFIILSPQKETNVREQAKIREVQTGIVKGAVTSIKTDEVEIPATWFLILNSLFIITFAPFFSKWWESKYNPNASTKYGIGLILLGIGFAALAFGSMAIPSGAKTAQVSLIWLVLAYLFHTLGELCLSPVSLSYVSKLVPARMIAMMFGIWYIAIAIGNKLAGLLGGSIDKITEQYDMTTFFLIFTLIPIALGLIGVALGPVVKKLMHGVR